MSPAFGCSLLLKADDVQCHVDSDCVRFPNAGCDVTTSLCVVRSSWTNLDAAGTGGGVSPLQPGDGGRMDLMGDGARSSDAGISPPGAECPDLNSDGVPDCKQSLLVNPAFRTDLVGWAPELDMRQAFMAQDGAHNPLSGSIAVTNARRSDVELGSTMGGSAQCVRAVGPSSYDVLVQVLLSPPAASGDVAWGGVAFQFFATTDCSGTALGASSPTLSDANITGWQLIRGVVSPAPGTRGMLVRLVVVKPFKQQPTQGVFDNVLIKGRTGSP
ncbi:MAG: hypothetical protein ABJA82_01595 [Myxococcales bacterium]